MLKYLVVVMTGLGAHGVAETQGYEGDVFPEDVSGWVRIDRQFQADRWLDGGTDARLLFSS